MTGQFVISLDFELLWGVRDHADRDSYGANILGGRAAIPRMLDMFAEYGISATWATVGFLFCENRDELMDILPEPDLRPTYKNQALSNYSYLSEVGADEAADPFYFAPSLIQQIAGTPRQEIATHTLSHYYCLEDGATDAAFEADLNAALELASRRGIQMKSIVFPRNQYSKSHIDICDRLGLHAHRGNPTSYAYQPKNGAGQTPLRRGLRLLDAYSGFRGHHTFKAEGHNVPASQFLRPCSGRLAPLHPAHIRTVMAGMTRAAHRKEGYHLWWHPHNFGRDTDSNLRALEDLLLHFQRLKESHGMQSVQMIGAACD